MLLLVLWLALVACASCDETMGLVVSGAMRTAHCSSVGTHNPVARPPTTWPSNLEVEATETVDTFAGIYHAAPFCPALCFAACRYGCISCKVRC